MRSLFFLAVILSAVLLGQSERLYIPFVNDEIVDYPIVSIQLGNPSKPYRLRVVFTSHVASVCDSSAFVALFNAVGTLKHKSSTFETLIPKVLGRDIIEVAGWRQWVSVAFTQQPNLMLAPSDSEQGDSYEGLLCFNAASNVWPIHQALINRHGIWIDTQESSLLLKDHGTSLLDRPASIDQAGNTSDLTLALQATLGCGWLNYRFRSQPASVKRVRLCIAPDIDDTLVPDSIFSDYFGDASIYEAQRNEPWDWAPLSFEHANSPKVALSIYGQHIMPLNDGVYALDLLRLKTNPAAVVGGDTLKLLPHNGDNETVIVGGHALWSTTLLHLSWSPSISEETRVHLYTAPVEYVLTIWQAIALLLVGLLYIRWKLSRQSLDSGFDPKSGIRHGYIKRSEMDDLLWPILVPLWLTPVVVLWRYQAIADRIHQGHVVFLMIMVAIAYVVMVSFIIFIDGRKAGLLIKDWLVYVKKRIFNHPTWWLEYLVLGEGRDILQKQTEILFAPVYETRLSYACVRDAAIDVLFGGMAWMLLAVLESHVFSLPILFASLMVLTLSLMYTLFTIVFAIFWPISLSLRIKRRLSARLQPTFGDVISLMLVMLSTIYTAYLLVSESMSPLFLAFGSPYGSGDTGLVVIAMYLLSVFAFIAASSVDVNIQNQLPAPRSMQNKKNDKRK